MIEVLDPTAKAAASEAQIAPRVSDLNGKRIGFLDNRKANAGGMIVSVSTSKNCRGGFPPKMPLTCLGMYLRIIRNGRLSTI